MHTSLIVCLVFPIGGFFDSALRVRACRSNTMQAKRGFDM